MFDNAPGVNQFNGIKVVDASVRSQIVGWNDKIREYLREIFADDIERVQGTRFGDNISKITYITERVVTEPDAFRGVRVYIDVGFVEIDGGEMELTPEAADEFLDEQRRFRRTGRSSR